VGELVAVRPQIALQLDRDQLVEQLGAERAQLLLERNDVLAAVDPHRLDPMEEAAYVNVAILVNQRGGIRSGEAKLRRVQIVAVDDTVAMAFLIDPQDRQRRFGRRPYQCLASGDRRPRRAGCPWLVAKQRTQHHRKQWQRSLADHNPQLCFA
jgi:hypothetical protein